jgi:hypothetical protein
VRCLVPAALVHLPSGIARFARRYYEQTKTLAQSDRSEVSLNTLKEYGISGRISSPLLDLPRERFDVTRDIMIDLLHNQDSPKTGEVALHFKYLIGFGGLCDKKLSDFHEDFKNLQVSGLPLALPLDWKRWEDAQKVSHFFRLSLLVLGRKRYLEEELDLVGWIYHLWAYVILSLPGKSKETLRIGQALHTIYQQTLLSRWMILREKLKSSTKKKDIELYNLLLKPNFHFAGHLFEEQLRFGPNITTQPFEKRHQDFKKDARNSKTDHRHSMKRDLVRFALRQSSPTVEIPLVPEAPYARLLSGYDCAKKEVDYVNTIWLKEKFVFFFSNRECFS